MTCARGFRRLMELSFCTTTETNSPYALRRWSMTCAEQAAPGDGGENAAAPEPPR